MSTFTWFIFVLYWRMKDLTGGLTAQSFRPFRGETEHQRCEAHHGHKVHLTRSCSSFCSTETPTRRKIQREVTRISGSSWDVLQTHGLLLQQVVNWPGAKLLGSDSSLTAPPPLISWCFFTRGFRKGDLGQNLLLPSITEVCFAFIFSENQIITNKLRLFNQMIPQNTGFRKKHIWFLKEPPFGYF